MSYLIRCYTLFDITTNKIVGRKPPMDYTEAQKKEWQLSRNSQLNFDTIIQLISLRSQPENISLVTKDTVKFKETDIFGFLFEEEEDQTYWFFDFSISHSKVFDDGISELGLLHSDCDGVPMLKTSKEWNKLPDFLDTTPELKNIHFEVIG